MNLHIISLIVKREYLTKVKKKSFLIITFLAPIFFAAMVALPSILMLTTKEKAEHMAVVDESGIVMPFLTSSEAISYTDCTGMDVDNLKTNLSDLDFDVLLTISPLDTVSKTVSAATYSTKPVGVDASENINRKINDAIEAYRVSSYEIMGLEDIMKDVRSNMHMTTYTLGEDGSETLSSSEIYMIVSMLLAMVIYMFIAMFCGMVMTSVIEEKASRVVEVLISSVKATELMFGKIIGVALVAITQFILWIALTGAILGIVGGLFGKDILSSAGMDQTAQMTEMMESMGVDPSMTGMSIPTADFSEPSEMEAILSTVKELPLVTLAISFIIYFVLGYLLYASLFAAIGSAVENEADTQQLQMPVTIPLLIGFLIAFIAFKSPDSPVVFWGSMVPFTSPIVMLARIPYGVPVWQIALSIVLLVGTFALCAWASAKIYKVGILMFGKKSTFKDLWKWLKQD
ncbi:MAG: ABC transporter permease [Bacteroidales bacterium]|nr:ABC transporter permease [Bacteroidales bacterium]